MNTMAAILDAPHVQEFCTSVAPDSIACEVECLPLLGEPFNECFSIVPKQIAAHGGVQLTGWAIWEFPGLYIEAEFHAVWQRPDGQIVDITPRPVYFSSILFLPDTKRQYAGIQVDNIRKPLVRDNDLTRFIFLMRRRFEIINQGDLADQHGQITLSNKAAREYSDLIKEVTKLQGRLQRRYATRA